ncbi:enolase C-terminal domain-like protein [Aquabacterium sp. J223]|uniref:enolase C-terminal domain-like protein n=1 Tax=Aquabacterium sp. J223 TaxID=2898431 RepID=UPI0021AE2D1F|nr:enolase C-terminal domain-like protein [Aquabacterium sp. J223]UUX95237.1 mandelate racemase [Aquabacterium sp. J223]
MRITDLTLTMFTVPGVPPTRYAAHLANLSGTLELGLLTLDTDEGVQGHAFLGSAMRPAGLDAAALMQGLKPLLMGEDPLERERLHELMRRWSRTSTLRPMGTVDVALWDIAGKVAGLPIHRLLGGYRQALPAYASSQKLSGTDAYVEQALHFKSLGWTAYKIHPVGEASQDIAICEAVRRAVGDGYTLMLDASFAYRFDEAVRVGRAIEQLGFRWYEDPLTENDVYNCRKLRDKLDIPLMATELPIGGLDTYAVWLTERATDYLRGDVPLKGGITTMVKTAHLAEAFNLQYEVHHGGNSLNNLAGLHVALAIRNTEFFEVLLPVESHRHGLVQDIEVDAKGLVQAPAQPGLGLDIDFDLVRRGTNAVLR